MAQVLEFQRHAFETVRADANAEDEFFYASQNAMLVKDAETIIVQCLKDAKLHGIFVTLI